MATAGLNVREVARKLSMSPGTVSRAVRGLPGKVSVETAEKVLSYCARNGLMSEAEVRCILLNLMHQNIKEQVFTVAAKGQMSFYQDVKAGICEYLQSIGIFPCSFIADDIEQVAAFPYDKAGVVIAIGTIPNEFLKQLFERKPAIVLVDNRVSSYPICSVNSDNFEAVRRSVEILAGLGHKNIAFACMHEDMPSYTYTFHQRQMGFMAGIESCKCNMDKSMLVLDSWQMDSNRSMGSSKHRDALFSIARRVLDIRPRPTAVIAANDCMAYVIRTVCQENGLRVPEDMSIIGYDGAHLSGENVLYQPAVSTNVVNWHKMGREAVELAMHMQFSKETGKSIEVATVYQDHRTVSKPKPINEH
jgi:LacI family repressor for deo operon, udp, cdd, tsx, nupC, and nupG